MALKSCGIAVTLAFALLTASVGTAGAVGPGGICGPILNGLCDPGLFCDRKANTCNLIGGTGKCVKISAKCPRVMRPVCGCNGMTYTNDCERIKAGMQKAHDGKC